MYLRHVDKRLTIARWHALGLLLACFALGLRIVTPVGFMPGVTADGRATLVICSSELSAHSQGDKGQHGPQSEAPCAFAGQAAAPAAEGVAVPMATSVAYAAPARAVPRDVIPGRGLTAPPPPSTGPPIRLA